MMPFSVATTARGVMEVEECCRNTKAEHQGVSQEISHCSGFTFSQDCYSKCRWLVTLSTDSIGVTLPLQEGKGQSSHHRLLDSWIADNHSHFLSMP